MALSRVSRIDLVISNWHGKEAGSYTEMWDGSNSHSHEKYIIALQDTSVKLKVVKVQLKWIIQTHLTKYLRVETD